MSTNRLLNGLSRKNQRQLLAACDEVHLNIGDVIWEPQQPIRYVYFPLSCFISQLVPVDSHANLELALVGDEGMLGATLLLGVNRSVLQALVQGSGDALRLRASSLKRELERMPGLRTRLNRYVFVLHGQLAITAACISFHSVDLRLARWLLMTHDRAPASSFYLTHDFLAQMLGVRRVSVTNAAGRLQERKLLRYARGEITILDRAGLLQSSCNCYQSSIDFYQRILG